MRSTRSAVPAWPLAMLLALVLFASLGQADVRFTEPSAGSNLTAGQIDVRWEDSGISPPISELTQYTLSLMVGGNDDGDMQPISTFVSQGTFSNGHTAQGTIQNGIAADVPNGFFFRMTSTREEGGVVINYSDRFSLSGLTGETALKIRRAAQALDGDTDGPPAVGNDASSSSSSTTNSSPSTSSTGQPSSTTDSSAETSSTASATSSATPTASLPNDDDEEDSPSSGLSKGATAGIAVAITIAVIAIVSALASYLYVQRRRKQNEIQEIAPGRPFQQHRSMTELSAEELLRPKAVWTHHTELSSDSMLHEAGSGERLPELDQVVFRAELYGSEPSTPK